MKTFARTISLAGLLLIGGSAFGAQISIGIRIGPPPPPRVVVVPRSPGPGYAWVGGYWYAVGSRYKWHAGYWSRPPYAGYAWVAPRYEGGQFYAGYWDGPRGHVEHDHKWDRDHDRDWHEHH